VQLWAIREWYMDMRNPSQQGEEKIEGKAEEIVPSQFSLISNEKIQTKAAREKLEQI
jgi:hypothetical protein